MALETEIKLSLPASAARRLPAHGLLADSVQLASADASFRRYLRIDSAQGTRIIMDAPPDKEDCRAFVRVAELMAQAGLKVPQVLAWDQAHGFLLLTDLGQQTMMQAIDREHPQANLALYLDAVDALVCWQKASRPGVLPPAGHSVTATCDLADEPSLDCPALG